jgi:hypothetical protein
MMNSRIVLLLALFNICACASSPDYVAADHAEDYGHYSRKISENRYRVSFNGSRHTSLQESRDYALLRAAELTLAEGNDWFQIVDRETAMIETVRQEPHMAVGFERTRYVERNCGLVACSRRTWPATYSHVQFDNSRPTSRHSHYLEILMGSGEMPHDGNYYDARSVVKSIYKAL